MLDAGSGEDALGYVDGNQGLDVVFTDVQLGGEVNGWDVGEAFRWARPDVGVIYTSGLIISPPRQVKGSRFFAKPYSPAEIAQACRDLAPAAA